MIELIDSKHVHSFIRESDGICNLISNLFMQHILTRGEVVAMKEEMFTYLASIDKFSFNRVYPLVHPFMSEDEAYQLNSLWDRRTAYGKLRYEVLEHLIKYTNNKRRELCKYRIEMI